MPWQPTGIVFPDIEQVLVDRYRTELAARPESYAADVHVSNAVPNPREDRMLVVRRDGGTQAEFRDRPRVSLRVWAMTEEDVTDLARLVAALAPTFADGDPIVAVPSLSRSGPIPVPDESGQQIRLLNIEFHTRGEPL